MKSTTVFDEEEKINFAKNAAKYFSEHDDKSSYGIVGSGELLALRWGLGDDCVLVLKLDEYFEPIIYGQLINVKQP